MIEERRTQQAALKLTTCEELDGRLGLRVRNGGPRIVPAGFGQRLASGAIDGGVCLLAASLLNAGRRAVGGDGRVSLATGGIALLLALVYLAGGAWRGQTLGMRLAGVRLAARVPGRRLAPARLAARALMSVLPALAAVALLLSLASPRVTLGRDGDGLAAAANWRALDAGGLLLTAAVGLAGQLWMLRDPQRQTWADKLGRAIVVHAPREASRELEEERP